MGNDMSTLLPILQELKYNAWLALAELYEYKNALPFALLNYQRTYLCLSRQTPINPNLPHHCYRHWQDREENTAIIKSFERNQAERTESFDEQKTTAVSNINHLLKQIELHHPDTYYSLFLCYYQEHLSVSNREPTILDVAGSDRMVQFLKVSLACASEKRHPDAEYFLSIQTNFPIPERLACAKYAAAPTVAQPMTTNASTTVMTFQTSEKLNPLPNAEPMQSNDVSPAHALRVRVDVKEGEQLQIDFRRSDKTLMSSSLLTQLPTKHFPATAGHSLSGENAASAASTIGSPTEHKKLDKANTTLTPAHLMASVAQQAAAHPVSGKSGQPRDRKLKEASALNDPSNQQNTAPGDTPHSSKPSSF